MKPSFILEGPNGSGKSTLGKKLSEVYGLPYVHTGPDPGSNLNAIEACADQLTLLKKGVILDRCTPISRMVYQDGLSTQEYEMLAAFGLVMEKYAVIIYCTADAEFTEKPYYPEGHFRSIVESKEVIRAEYGAIMSSYMAIPYDFKLVSVETLLEVIRNARV